jgi:hypothetical protein
MHLLISAFTRLTTPHKLRGVDGRSVLTTS